MWSCFLYLVASKVLLVADVAAQNPQAELAQQMLGVCMRVLEVGPDVGVKGRTEVTHLQKKFTEHSCL